ncbi:glycosyltransferase [Natronorubrum sulfidifaciens]|uniref:Group 1 glycosyl transferase n=1 Tax=Natronorubrum sulfidifaciens JCM 14089 TaxID=1230460 RepID=L9VY37_9EURY|nr:glycosyltransferase [Natronorubrum sulfidifaciens]ELY42095.1 group 1 glycosyl transferase [Natronorubrum sulfidifaciens JCM 14089]
MRSDTETVVLLGDYDYDYYRELSLRDGLRSQGITVLECRFRDEPLSVGLKKFLLLPLFYVRIWRQMRRLAREESAIDAILVTKFNISVLPIAALFARRLDTLLVYDLFVSLYRTADMQDYPRWQVTLIYWLEWLTFRLPDYHLTETAEYARLYATLYSLPRSRIVGIPIGADDTWFHPREDGGTAFDRFTVVYWGAFLPHHGVETIVDAAAELAADDIQFVLIGEGVGKDRIERRVAEHGLENVEFWGRAPWETLGRAAAGADVTMGIFSDDLRAQASITNKVSEGIASGSAVITMDSPPIQRWFTHTEDIYLVPPEDPTALAAAIRTLRDDPMLRERIARGGRTLHETVFSVDHIGKLLLENVPFSERSPTRRSVVEPTDSKHE